MTTDDICGRETLTSRRGERRRVVALAPLFLRAVELLFCSIYVHRSHVGPGIHATFFISLWKREKCANQFLVVARRERLWKDRRERRGWEVKANSRVALESSCTCVIPIRCTWYRARVHHESARQLQVTCIVISKSSPGKPVFLHIARP